MSYSREIVGNVYTVLRQDETLLRLLYYPPAPNNPLDDGLNNILDLEEDEYWNIVDRHILLTSKADDLEENKLCRIYLYAGKKRPVGRNKYYLKQEVVLDVLCHQDYQIDQRLDWIVDTLSKKIFNSKVDGGLGRFDLFSAYDFKAPKGYEAYRLIYTIGDSR